jgi:hypothetical protein
MSRENSRKAVFESVIDRNDDEGFSVSGLPESYQSQVKIRSEMQRPAPAEVPATAEKPVAGVEKQALPAWIKAQVEQLEMRRLARHSAYLKGLSDMQGD